MSSERRVHLDAGASLADALIASSEQPTLLLNRSLEVIAASFSFYDAFQLIPISVISRPIFEVGAGEWNIPQLRSMLQSATAGFANVEAYELDLKSAGEAVRRLVLHATRLHYEDESNVRVLLTVSDVTAARHDAKVMKDLLREKDILLQEVQHRIANSLQVICGILLQSARKMSSQDSRIHLQDAHDRVMSIAAVQKHLAVSQLSEVGLRTYLTHLCQSLGASMIRNDGRLAIEVDVDETSVAADDSISLGLIVTELIINALKHAFPDGRMGVIKVSYRGQADGNAWTLSVADNGVGMRERPDDDGYGLLKDQPAATAGLGTSIVEALARQLQAHIDVAKNDPGTVITVAGIKAAPYASGGNQLPNARAV